MPPHPRVQMIRSAIWIEGHIGIGVLRLWRCCRCCCLAMPIVLCRCNYMLSPASGAAPVLRAGYRGARQPEVSSTRCI